MAATTSRSVRDAMVAVGLVVAGAWVWAAPSAGSSARVVVVGNGLISEASDDIGRRLRQRGWEVVVVDGVGSCAEARQSINGLNAERVVVSIAGAESCEGRFVAQSSSMLLGSRTDERVTCEWWDTPGAGESRPGLGTCRPDGSVVIRENGRLTAAGAERFARAIVAASE